MADYGYKSFLDNEKDNNTFSYEAPSYKDPNSSAWDTQTTPSQPVKVDAPTQAPTTPVAPATPATNDNNPATAQSNLAQAHVDAASAPSTWGREDDRDTYTSKRTGYSYDQPKDSHANDAYLGVMGFLAGYLRNADTGEGMDSAYTAVANNQDRVDRFKDVDYYEQKGYNPADIAAYLKSGKKEDLVKNKPEWASAGNGVIFEKNTGITQNVNGAAAGKQVDKTVDLGGTIEIHYKDGTVETRPKTMTPEQGQNVRTVDLGDRIETYDANGNLISSQPKGAAPSAKGSAGSASANKQENANAKEQATFDQQNRDLDKIGKTIDEAPDASFRVNLPKQFGTGTIPNLLSTGLATGVDLLNRDDKNSGATMNQADSQLTGVIRGIVVARAKADGQVGIDRDTEVDNLMKAAPQVDYTADAATQRRQQHERIEWVRNQMTAPIHWTTGQASGSTTNTAGSSTQGGGSSAPAAPGSFTTSGGVSYTVSKG